MANNLISEAYKPAEKLAFNYLMLRETLSRILKEQKFPTIIETMLLKVYKNFQVNTNKLIALYQKEKDVLPLDKLMSNIEDEVDAIFLDADMNQPLLDEILATKSLIKFIIDLEISFLSDSEKYKDAIPGFSWDIASFKKAFLEIEERGIEYVNKADNE